MPTHLKSGRWLPAMVFALDVVLGRPDAHAQARFETALVVAMDVSGSVDAKRYRLQIDGLAEALTDPQVDRAIVDSGGVVFMLVSWSDHAKVTIDWRRIGSVADAQATAALVRNLPPQAGDFTCIGRMFQTLSDDILPDLPASVTRTVIDVSGDGSDNCTDPDTLAEDRRAVLAFKTTVNGLPIVEHGVNDTVNAGAFRAPGYGLHAFTRDPGHDQTTLDRWYAAHVVGGPGAFTLVAKGYSDFTRALRRKFVLEISDARAGPER